MTKASNNVLRVIWYKAAAYEDGYSVPLTSQQLCDEIELSRTADFLLTLADDGTDAAYIDHFLNTLCNYLRPNWHTPKNSSLTQTFLTSRE